MLHSIIGPLGHNPQQMKTLTESIVGTPAQRQQAFAQLKASFAPVHTKELFTYWGIASPGATLADLNVRFRPVLADYLSTAPTINKRIVELTKNRNKK